MPDIDVDYATIDQVSSLLTSAFNNISPQITSLHTHVDTLLNKDGGLWMSQTSGAIQAQYEQFDKAAVQCCDAIKNFATLFANLKNNLQSVDNQMAAAIKNPPSS